MKYKTCVAHDCDNPLTGKQRKYCSRACGKRHRRYLDKHGTAEGQNVPEWGKFIGQNRPKWDQLSNVHRWRVTFDVEMRSNTARGEWDLRRINQTVRAELLRVLREYLAYKWPEWGVSVTDITSRYTGDFRWPD